MRVALRSHPDASAASVGPALPPFPFTRPIHPERRDPANGTRECSVAGSKRQGLEIGGWPAALRLTLSAPSALLIDAQRRMRTTWSAEARVAAANCPVVGATSASCIAI